MFSLLNNLSLPLSLFLITISLSFYANAKENLALPCEGCHGPNGNSPGNSIPSIAGLEKSYIQSALNEYKGDKRSNYLMRIIAKGYSQIEIEYLSEYFSKQNYD